MEKYADDAVIDSAEFGRVIRLALEAKVATAQEIGKEFGANTSTVEDWARGEGRLHLNVRPIVLNWLIDKTSAQA